MEIQQTKENQGGNRVKSRSKQQTGKHTIRKQTMRNQIIAQTGTQTGAQIRNQMEKTKSIKRRYQRKIILLRIEQLILLAVIVLLLCGSGNASALAEGAEQVSGKAERLVSSEIAVRDGDGQRTKNGFGYDSSTSRWLGEIALQGKNLDIQSEYKWLQKHKALFPKNKVEGAEGNAGLIHVLYTYGTGTYTVPEQQALKKEELEQDIPLLMQWDVRWGYETYGDSNIGICGCAPTCLAMVAVGLTQDERFTPAMVAAYAMKSDYYLAGTGTKWALFAGFAGDYGLICRTVGTDRSAILAELKKGNPVICSMSAGTFTLGGHFSVLCGEDNGKILVNDPNNVEYSNREWSIEEFADEIKNAWAFEKG